MARLSITEWANESGENFLIEYHYEGKYNPETLETPELIVDSITAENGKEIVSVPEEVYSYIESKQ